MRLNQNKISSVTAIFVKAMQFSSERSLLPPEALAENAFSSG